MSEYEQPEQPQSPELSDDQTRYSYEAVVLTEKFDTLDDAAKAEAMDQFVQRILNEASEGLVKSSRGDAYTPDMLRTQLEDFAMVARPASDNAITRAELDRIRMLSEMSKNEPANFIPRSGGMREAFMMLSKSEDVTVALVEAIDRERLEYEKAVKDLGEEAVDDVQAPMHAELVQTPPTTEIADINAQLDAASAARRVVEGQDKVIDIPEMPLPPENAEAAYWKEYQLLGIEDQRALSDYASYAHQVLSLRQNGGRNGQDERAALSQLDQIHDRLSPAGRAFLPKYLAHENTQDIK